MTISVKGSDLMLTGGEQNVPLLPTPHTGTYRWGERSVVFERQGGQITACRVGGGEGLVGVRFVRTGDAG